MIDNKGQLVEGYSELAIRKLRFLRYHFHKTYNYCREKPENCANTKISSQEEP